MLNVNAKIGSVVVQPLPVIIPRPVVPPLLKRPDIFIQPKQAVVPSLPTFPDIGKAIAKFIAVSKATAAANEVFTEPAGSVDAVGTSGAAVTTNYTEVNAPDATRDAQAAALVKKNAKLEAESLKSLSPSERAQYDQLAKWTDGKPQSRLALQLLAMQGKLTADPRATDGQSLLSTLSVAASETKAKGIDTKTLISDMLREIATPSAIAQKTKNTCAPTAVQIKLATDNPAEYARIVAGLSSESGSVTLANGTTIARDGDTAMNDGSGRTQSSRLFQAAMMELADGDLTYENGTDMHSDTNAGLGGGQLDVMMEALFNRCFNTEEVSGKPLEDRQKRVDDVEASTRAGNSVPVAIESGVQGDAEFTCHWINVTRVDGDRVFYQNPWGQEESMSRAEFAERIRAASLPA